MAEVKGYIALSEQEKNISIYENFKGVVLDKEIKFPKELGAVHPFSFEDMEKSFKKIGLINGVVNKIKNAIVGDFQLTVDNENIQAFIDDFLHTTNFPSILREWVKEAVLKGNGFMELDLENANVRVLNANNMYVKRDKKGKVKEYNQWLGNLNGFNRNSTSLTNFKPNQIAHLKMNKISNEPYGIGLIWPSERTITNTVQNEQDLHKLMTRKAGMPLHVKIGQPGESVQTEDIEAMSAKLQYMTNKTEWVTDGNIEMKLIDFAGIGNNLTSTLEYDKESLATSLNIPVVLLGKANVAEGLANAQSEDFERFIRSIREEIESIVEEKVIKPLLLSQKFPDSDALGLDKKAVGASENPNFIWNLPGESEINARIEKVTQLLNSFGISENMKRMLQLELAKLLDFDDASKFLLSPEPGLDKIEKDKEDDFKYEPKEEEKPKASDSPEAKKESKIKQPEVPGAKPGANASHDLMLIKNKHMPGCGCGQQLTESQSGIMSIREFTNLKEMAGFNYSDYLVRILKRLKTDSFADLAAMTDQDLINGLLDKREINKLRIILKDAFRKNKSIFDIQKEIDSSIALKDRLKDGKITAAAKLRPNMIARTEVVRLSNEGLLDTYKENNIQKVRFLAALSERTCPQCEALNGQVFELNESRGIIPVHVACRCTWLSVLE